MASGSAGAFQVDESYEFHAPRFFDFTTDETLDEIHRAERWLETSLSYAPSPFVPRIEVTRAVQMDSLCNFGDVEKAQKEPEQSRHDQNLAADDDANVGHNQEINNRRISFEFVCDAERPKDINASLPMSTLVELPTSSMPKDDVSKGVSHFTFPILSSADDHATSGDLGTITEGVTIPSSKNHMALKGCTPKAQKLLTARGDLSYCSKNQTAKKPTNMIAQSAASRQKNPSVHVQSTKGTNSLRKCFSAVKGTVTTDIAQQNQAIKRQKLDGGRARQIIDIKNRALLHKSKPNSTGGTVLFASGTENHCETAPFISTAEMVRKFQSKTRDLDLSHNRSLSKDNTASVIQRRPKLTLTRPKDPEFETSHRVRAVRVKSSAELEEEMLAKIPKFKARPLNKKILEVPSLLSLPKSAPQPPEFREFHLKTMERAIQHAETSSSVSTTKDTSCQNQEKPLKLTEPRPPELETALRARPTKVKTSQELELEELEKMPKFKARPLSRKVLESKGDLGVFCKPKPQVTTPEEFHFATSERLGPPATVVDLFDKLSLHSETHRDLPRVTVPIPFHLNTEERGIEKERQFIEQILRKQLDEERARVPKANPYPYTTDYPVIPPKPAPKESTRPEAFQLESLVRHEEEMQRKLEERLRMEKEEAERRKFKAQPILREDPLPLPEKERKPLTEVQEFVLHVDHRALDRSEFDKKMKEKETVYKRLREEYESAKMIEEEKEVKKLRRRMVPHARPLPKFDNPFHPQKSTKEITRPISPNLHVAQREQRHTCHMR